MNILAALWAKAVLFVQHARGKVTTYVGLLIAASAEIRNQWPDLTAQLPHSPWVLWLEAHSYVLLGFLVVWARVRRLLGTPT